MHFCRENGWIALVLAKALMGHQSALWDDGGRSGGFLTDDMTRSQVLIFNLSTDPEDIFVAQTIVDRKNAEMKKAVAGDNFVHLEHIDPNSFGPMLHKWSASPGEKDHQPEFMHKWRGEMGASFDLENKNDRSCVYIPPVVIVLAHGSTQDLNFYSSRDKLKPFFEFRLIQLLFQLLANMHIPPHVFALNVCFAAEVTESGASGQDSVVARLSRALHPLPFVAYVGELSFSDLLFGHPFWLLHMLAMLFQPMRVVMTPQDSLLHQAMASDPVSPIVKAFSISARMADPLSAHKALLFNDNDPYTAVNRDKLWQYWKEGKRDQGKMTWYSAMKLTQENNAAILSYPRMLPVRLATVGGASTREEVQMMLEVKATVYQELAQLKYIEGVAHYHRGSFRYARAVFGQVTRFADTRVAAGVILALKAFINQHICLKKLGCTLASFQPLESCLLLVEQRLDLRQTVQAYQDRAHACVMETLRSILPTSTSSQIDLLFGKLLARVEDAVDGDREVVPSTAFSFTDLDTLGDRDKFIACMNQYQSCIDTAQFSALKHLLESLADLKIPNKYTIIPKVTFKKQGHHAINSGLLEFHKEAIKRRLPVNSLATAWFSEQSLSQADSATIRGAATDLPEEVGKPDINSTLFGHTVFLLHESIDRLQGYKWVGVFVEDADCNLANIAGVLLGSNSKVWLDSKAEAKHFHSKPKSVKQAFDSIKPRVQKLFSEASFKAFFVALATPADEPSNASAAAAAK